MKILKTAISRQTVSQFHMHRPVIHEWVTHAVHRWTYPLVGLEWLLWLVQMYLILPVDQRVMEGIAQSADVTLDICIRMYLTTQTE